MTLSGTFVFAGPQPAVWDLLHETAYRADAAFDLATLRLSSPDPVVRMLAVDLLGVLGDARTDLRPAIARALCPETCS